MKKSNNLKKYTKGNKIQTPDTSQQLNTLIKITIGVVLFVVLAYVTMALITGKLNLKGKETKTETEIQYTEILAGSILKQKQKEYYVLFYNMNNKNAFVDAIIEDLSSTKKVYKVDLTKKFNESYVSDEVNKNATGLDDLKVASPTMIKVSNGKIVKVVTGNDEISSYTASQK